MQTKNETKPGSAGDLKHPRREEWMAYLYQEISRAEKDKLAAHLRECNQCRVDVANWQSAMRALDQGAMILPRVRKVSPWPLIKWGIAAALVLGIGFSAGRLASVNAVDSEQLRASLKVELRAELMAELKQQELQLADYKVNAEQKRIDDNKLIFTALDKIESNRRIDYASLHKELETVAVFTQASLQQTQRQIGTLAAISEPTDKSSN